jgi:glycosyltransferase involved in cell wall biosynthesis
MHPLVNKDVLVIVPTNSRDHTFSYTIDSILNQSYKNFNLAIVGDGVTE